MGALEYRQYCITNFVGDWLPLHCSALGLDSGSSHPTSSPPLCTQTPPEMVTVPVPVMHASTHTHPTFDVVHFEEQLARLDLEVQMLSIRESLGTQLCAQVRVELVGAGDRERELRVRIAELVTLGEGVPVHRVESSCVVDTDHPRWVTSDYRVTDVVVVEMLGGLGLGGERPTVDAFASRGNARFGVYWCKESTGKYGRGSFGMDWGAERLLWVNAPFEHLGRVTSKLVRDGARAVVVVPEWNEWWFRTLRSMSVREYKVPRERKIFTQGGGVAPLPQREWNTWAFLLPGDRGPAF